MQLRLFLCLALVVLGLVGRGHAFTLEASSWTRDRTVVMQLSLGGPIPLNDGFKSFNESALDALNIWNQHLAHLHFAAVMNSPVPVKSTDDQMSVVFSNTVDGDAFGNGTLAVTLLYSRGTVMEQTDTYFNTAYEWDSYRGPLHFDGEDFHRVAIHEFGHTLGLDHPDQAGQHVTAIMNSTISNVDTVQADDIAGVQALYANGPAYQNAVNASVLQNISTRGFVGTGDNVLIGGFIIQGPGPATVLVRGIGFSLSAVGITDALSDPVITVFNSNHQVVATNDDWFTSSDNTTIASYRLDPANSIESALIATLNPGNYTVVVEGFSDANTPAATGVGLFELYDLHTTGGRAGNVSTRGQVGTGGRVLIGGFIIGGNQGKQVVVRALGPTLTNAGVPNALPDPTIELHNGNGATLQFNDNWQQGSDAAAISSAGFAPADGREAALLATLNPGNYTAVVQSADGVIGLGLVEVYDLSSP
ncbi:MAG TPA: matrixin family metalloprotease [Chthoniobacterales bacterium]|nr:matrixin family metalloprotease [Chthoniobacterales bacterium]